MNVWPAPKHEGHKEVTDKNKNNDGEISLDDVTVLYGINFRHGHAEIMLNALA